MPAVSGTGRRVVFSQDLQQVWLVNANDAVKRTYPVSGSVTNNLQPGTYSVYSRSRWAVGVDDSGVMQYFVRFTKGPTGAAYELPYLLNRDAGGPPRDLAAVFAGLVRRNTQGDGGQIDVRRLVGRDPVIET